MHSGAWFLPVEEFVPAAGIVGSARTESGVMEQAEHLTLTSVMHFRPPGREEQPLESTLRRNDVTNHETSSWFQNTDDFSQHLVGAFEARFPLKGSVGT